MVMRKKGNDHQPKMLLIVKQSLLVNTLGNIQKCIENFVENMQLLILGHKGLTLAS